MAAFVSGISVRLLTLTIVVIMLVEVAIFVPSIARFRLAFMEERLVRAEIAAFTILDGPGMPEPVEKRRLIDSVEALDIHVREDGDWRRVVVATEPEVPEPIARFLLLEDGTIDLILDGLACLLVTRSGDIHYVESTTQQAIYDRVGITFRADELRREMIDYGLRILQLSLIISVVTAGVVFVVVRRFIVAPLLDVVRGVERFHADPEDPARIIRPTARRGEVADAERAIAAMQTEVLRALSERRRLAALGEAVARINHDLRNMLAAGRLMTERLSGSNDPLVARTLPKLVGSLDRAVALCRHTLAFGRAEERAPEPRDVMLRALVVEVVEGLGLIAETEDTASTDAPENTLQGPPESPPSSAPRSTVVEDGPVRLVVRVPETVTAEADSEHLYRILANLLRNAVEAIRASGRAGRVEVSARHAAVAPAATAGPDAARGVIEILVADTGPGLPLRARENLFRPFQGSARRGGTGLGLAIAADLAQLQGGALRLVETSTAGTTFALTLPASRSRPGAPAVEASAAITRR